MDADAAGYKIVGKGLTRKAELTNFFAAGFNPSTLPRYAHTIDAVLMVGGFIAIALAAYYFRRGDHADFARKTMATGIAIAGVTTVLMLPIGHWQAVNVVTNQPSKVAAFEGHWNDGPMSLGLIGYVDEASGKTVSIAIPNGVNFLVGDFSGTKSFPGLNSFAPEDRPPVQLTYQTYHFMILLWGLMLLLVGAAWLLNKRGKLQGNKRLLGWLVWSPVLPMLSIQLGWAAAEVGRQPWIVWNELRTVDAISKAVPAGEILTTLVLFVLFYTIIYVAWDGSSSHDQEGPDACREGGVDGTRRDLVRAYRVLLAGYAIFDGFDLGVGVLLPSWAGPSGQGAVRMSVGPVWDGNEVWLLTGGGGALFAAFPACTRPCSRLLHRAHAAAVRAHLRAASLEFRHRDPAWAEALGLGVLPGQRDSGTPVRCGRGNIIRGLPLTPR